MHVVTESSSSQSSTFTRSCRIFRIAVFVVASSCFFLLVVIALKISSLRALYEFGFHDSLAHLPLISRHGESKETRNILRRRRRGGINNFYSLRSATENEDVLEKFVQQDFITKQKYHHDLVHIFGDTLARQIDLDYYPEGESMLSENTIKITKQPISAKTEESAARLQELISEKLQLASATGIRRKEFDGYHSVHLPQGVEHLFVAANLHNNEAILPTWLREMKRFLLFLSDFASPMINQDDNLNKENVSDSPPLRKKKIFVSIFTNLCKDRTNTILRHDFIPWLLEHDIPFHLNLEGQVEGGYRVRPGGMERIRWLSRVRNAAMRPLWDDGMRLFFEVGDRMKRMRLMARAKGRFSINNTAERKKIDASTMEKDFLFLSEERIARRQTQQLLSIAVQELPKVAAVKVLFLNDIIFTAEDLLVLLHTNRGDYDMTCGMDFHWNFYDTWVTRDLNGRPFWSAPPFSQIRQTKRDFQDLKPTRVSCCWNGAMFAKAAVFVNEIGSDAENDLTTPKIAEMTSEENLLIEFQNPVLFAHHAKNIAFRAANEKSACSVSECLLLCKDMQMATKNKNNRNNKNKFDAIFINPLVRVGYRLEGYLNHHGKSPALDLFEATAWVFSRINSNFVFVQHLQRQSEKIFVTDKINNMNEMDEPSDSDNCDFIPAKESDAATRHIIYEIVGVCLGAIIFVADCLLFFCSRKHRNSSLLSAFLGTSDNVVDINNEEVHAANHNGGGICARIASRISGKIRAAFSSLGQFFAGKSNRVYDNERSEVKNM